MARFKKHGNSSARRKKPSGAILSARLPKLQKALKQLRGEPLNPSGGMFLRTPVEEKKNELLRQAKIRGLESRIFYTKRELNAREINNLYRNKKRKRKAPQKKWKGKTVSFKGHLEETRLIAIDWLIANHPKTALSWASASLPGNVHVSSPTGNYARTRAFLETLEDMVQGYVRFSLTGEELTTITISIWAPKREKKREPKRARNTRRNPTHRRRKQRAQ